MPARRRQISPVLFGFCVLPVAGLPIVLYSWSAAARGVDPASAAMKICAAAGLFLAALLFEMADRLGVLRTSERGHLVRFRKLQPGEEAPARTSVINDLRGTVGAAAAIALPTGLLALAKDSAADEVTDIVVDAVITGVIKR